MRRGLIRSRHSVLFWAIGLMLALAACEQAAVNPPQPTTITIGGATAMQPVLHDLTIEFSRQYPNVVFNWLSSSSEAGEERLRAGQVDLAASTLPPTTMITATAVTSATTSSQAPRTKSSAFIYVPIGLDGLALIVDPSNKIENLTTVQLRDLFSGRILDWSTLGGEPSEVQLVSREDGSGSRYLFESHVMAAEPVALTAVVMPSSADVVDYVAQNPGAIGYVSRAYVIDLLATQAADTSDTATPRAANQASQKQVRVVQLENQLPSVENIKNQRYFLTTPLYLVSRGQPRGWSRSFVDFVLSPAGQTIVERYHARVR